MAATAFADADQYHREFENFAANRHEPDDLLRLRRQALQRLETLGLPSSRQEAWRFTDVSALGQIAFQRAGDAPVAADRLPVLDGPHHRLVFVTAASHRVCRACKVFPIRRWWPVWDRRC